MWCGVWCGEVSFGVVWCVVWCDVVSCGVQCCGVYVYVKRHFSFFWAWCSPATGVFFLILSTAGSAREPSVQYDACLDPGRAPRRRSERSKPLERLFLSRDCGPPR